MYVCKVVTLHDYGEENLRGKVLSASISSLDIALRRIENIERQFNALSGVQIQKRPDVDFQTILNSNIQTQKPENVDYKSVQEPVMSTSRAEIENLIEKYAQKNNLDKDFVKAVIKQESGFNAKAKSHCGAMGLMQLMPQTAMGLGVDNAYDAEQNIMGGTKYLKNLLTQYNGDKQLALAAYNAGPGAVKRFGGVPPYNETQNYVKNVIANYNRYKGGAS